MADEKNAAPTEEFNDDGTKNPDYVASAGSEGADDTKKTDKTDDTENKDDKGADEDDGEFDDDIEKNPPKPPVRTSVAQHIIARKNAKIKKLESKSDDEDKGDDEPADKGGEDNEEEDSNLTPDAIKAIGKNVQKVIAPLMSKLASDADKAEFEELVKAEPEAAKYANHIKAYMAHEAYKGVSPVVIFHHLAFESARMMGAKKRATADLEAKQNKSGGRTVVKDKTNVGNLPSAEDIEGMSDAEFEKMENDARQGKYSK